jgi:lactate dehydrogenase-like 2-hydroxyacid dehydrogenase
VVLEQRPIHSSSLTLLPGQKKAKTLILTPLLHSTQPEETKRRNDFATAESRRQGDWSMSALKGKTAVITGGRSGIGLAAAKRFVAEGAFVFISGRPRPELDQAAKEIGKNVIAVMSDAPS